MKTIQNSSAIAFLTCCIMTFQGCKKDTEIPSLTMSPTIPTVTTAIVSGISITSATSGGDVTADGGAEVTFRGVCWSSSQLPTISDSRTINGADTGSFISNLTGLYPGTTYVVRAYAVSSAGVAYGNEFSFTTLDQGTGTRKADFPGGARALSGGFSIGTKVYMGLGIDDSDGPGQGFWEWDQVTNKWAKIADFPGGTAADFVSFSIGNKGYIGTLKYISFNSFTYDFWEYDPAKNTWTQKASIPTTQARSEAVGFSIGTKGYIGLGRNVGITSVLYNKDFWEWDQVTNIWTRKADYPGNARIGTVGFSIGNKGYIGTGSDGTSLSKEFWEWDQITNVWAKKADFAGNERVAAVGFSIGGKGYIGTGINGGVYTPYKDFWEWDQATDVWTEKADLKGGVRASAVGVSIGGKAYIGTGFGGYANYMLQDFWEYDPTIK
jgi:hypothetical protein